MCKKLINFLLIGSVVAVATLLSGCVTNPQIVRPGTALSTQTGFNSIFNNSDPCSNNDRNIGIVVGVVIGALIGYASHKKKGAFIGAAVGATGGGLLGHMQDQRRCNLYKIAQANHLKFADAIITNKKLGLASRHTQEASHAGQDMQLQIRRDEFVPGTAQLTPKAEKYFTEFAKQYIPSVIPGTAGRKRIVEQKVLIVVHSDESSDPRRSARVTQERAHAVAEIFRRTGVPSRDIYYQGAGDTLPIASNATSAGRSENQRVEIVNVPNKSDLRHYLQLLRQPNGTYFRTATTTHQPSSHPHKTAIASRPRVRRRYAGYNFGGTPLKLVKVPSINLGAPIAHSAFSIISEAHAGTLLVVGSCMNDRPRFTTAVRNLATGRGMPVRSYMPGFYGTPWLGGFHGNLVVVLNAYIPRDFGSPVPEPKLVIYKRYRNNRNEKPSYMAHVPVNVYRGEKGTLYRMFVKGPLQCIDLVKTNSPGNAKGRLYYPKNGKTYLAFGAFALYTK